MPVETPTRYTGTHSMPANRKATVRGATAPGRPPSDFGRHLRHWRAARGLSQLDLALQAEISARHLGFVERGRATPSREMVLHLCTALDVPARERNTLLVAAGYAPLHPETPLGTPAMADVRWLLDLMLRQQEPYPAVVVDRAWNTVMRNDAATRLGAWLFDDFPPALRERPNTIRLALHPDGLRRFALNWPQVAADLVRRLDRQARAPGAGDDLRALRDEVLAYPEVPSPRALPAEHDEPAVLLPLHLRKGDVELRLVSALTKIATSDDVTVQELCVESLLPADDATARALERLRV